MTPTQCVSIALLAILLPIAVSAQDSQRREPSTPSDTASSRFLPPGYIRLAGSSGVSIEVPSDWRVLTLEELARAARDARTLLPPGAPTGRPEIYASARLAPVSGAVISVAVQMPPTHSQKSLASTSPSTLRATSDQLSRELKGKRSQSGIGTLLSDLTYEIRPAPGTNDRVLVTTYREEELSKRGSSLIWKTTHLHIPRGSDEVQVTLSYREADEMFWRPVMERATASLRY